MSIAERLASVRAEIDDACRAAGRDPAAVRLLPLSKYHGPDQIREAHAAGYSLFGENKVQELAAKHAELAGEGIGFAVIGHVQTNKAKAVAELAAELHSLDSLRLAEALQRRLEQLGHRLPVLIQVNTSHEEAKSGIALEDAVTFARELSSFDALEARGLMTMAINSPDVTAVAACFSSLVEAQSRIRDSAGGGWDELSMGMSSDFRIAIAHGATTVRLGTAVFGPRGY
ncbi:MAG TPA: YggS family pyridoxal phosphate-dependent enzyme [Arachnia sp.]|nr:YggS family pyridoxal phosphate-dependent enzyme [Arachnia sp.]